LGLDVGRFFFNWAELRAGIVEDFNESKIIFNDPGQSQLNFDRGLLFSRFSVDTLDKPFFPRNGSSGFVDLRGGYKELGSGTDFRAFEIDVIFAESIKNHIFNARGIFGTNLDDAASLPKPFTLGGFHKLSGLSQAQLVGEHMAFGALIYNYHLKQIEFLPTYLGGSLEWGGVWTGNEDISLSSGLVGGSVYLGMETIFGPAYFAYGRAEGGNESWYLFIGQTFK